ncbi:DUF4035 domain-containing protein [Morganella morganii]
MFFLMTLALRMGRTVDELTRTMSAGELTMWMAFDRLSPIGDIRSDIQTAHIVSSLYGAQGGKLISEVAIVSVTLATSPEA